ncbi:MAG: hypothetical protein AB1521_06615 [Bacteroidota bacterium]
MKYKLLIFMRLNSKLNFETMLKNFGSSIIYLGFALGAFWFSQKFINFIVVEVKVGLFLLHEFISMILFIFFVAVNIGNTIVSYSTLYKSSEVNFLFSKPVPSSRIFVIKFLDNFFYSSSTLLLVLLSVLAGYSVYFKLNFFSFLFLFVFNFIPFIFSAGSLGVILLLLIIKAAAKFGFRRVVFFIAAIYVITIFLFFKINSPVHLATSVMKLYPFIDTNQYLGEFIAPVIKFLPNNWLSEAAYWITRDQISKAIILSLQQIVISVLLFISAMELGRRWYLATWLKNIKLNAEKNETKNHETLFSFGSSSSLKSQTEAIIKRDIHLFIREPSQVIHFIVLVFLIVIFISSVSGIRYIGLGNFYLQTGIYLAVFMFNLLLISTISLRFIFPLISLEGLTHWKVRSAPVDNKFLIRRKISIIGSIILFIGTGLSYYTSFRFVFVIELMSMLTTVIAMITIISINLGMGGLFVNYKEKNPIRISSSQGASITFLICIIYMLFIIVLLFEPMSNYFLARMIGRHYNLFRLIYPVIPIAVVSFILTSIFLRTAANSLKKDF